MGQLSVLLLKFLYEGWGDEKPDRRALQDEELVQEAPISGRKTLWLSQSVQINGPSSDPVLVTTTSPVWLLDPDLIVAGDNAYTQGVVILVMMVVLVLC